jgi:TolB-like protein/Flp pilus assembly protein TadD
MELVEGQPLSDVIPGHGFTLSRLLDLALPIADAVSYAHKQGITHRDLKPSNIMLDAEGRPKVLDFGLAKLLEAPVTPDAATMADSGSITKEGRVLGTAAYMSPEQAEGKQVDARSDIFSLGIILYEMATGERPFTGDTSISTISSILKDHPPPVNDINHALPRHLGRIVNRCLAKDPDRRYQSGLDIRNELEGLKAETSGTGMEPVSIPRSPRRRPVWMGLVALAVLAMVMAMWRPWMKGGGDTQRDTISSQTAESSETESAAGAVAPQRTMIVVLPFENLGPPEDAYFAAGMTEEINNKLSSVPDLGVISRTSARRYADTEKSIREIGGELSVDYVVEGTVRWQKRVDGAGRVRVSPKLVRVSDATNLWSSQYDQELQDIFEIQDAIAGEIVAELGMALAHGDGSSGVPTRNVEAYQVYLRAMELFYDYARETTRDRFDEVLDLLDQAIELDPEFALAWAKSSFTSSVMFHEYMDRTEERLARAREAADRSLELDPDLPDAHLALGYYYYWGRQDYSRALEEFLKLGERVENDAEVLSATAFVWRRQGRWDEALANLQKAVRLSPNDLLLIGELAYTYQYLRRYAEADKTYDRCIALAPEVAAVYGEKAWISVSWHGDVGLARAELDKGPASMPSGWAYTRVYFDAMEGRYEEALDLLTTVDQYIDQGSMWYWPRPLVGAVISSLIDDEARTRTLADSARVFLEEKVKESPRDVRMRGALGASYALLGRKDEALREGKLSVDLMPMSRDQLRGTAAIHGLAIILTLVGDEEAAIDQIEFLLSVPGELSVHEAGLDPVFRRLRDNPRFDALLRKST